MMLHDIESEIADAVGKLTQKLLKNLQKSMKIFKTKNPMFQMKHRIFGFI